MGLRRTYFLLVWEKGVLFTSSLSLAVFRCCPSSHSSPAPSSFSLFLPLPLAESSHVFLGVKRGGRMKGVKKKKSVETSSSFAGFDASSLPRREFFHLHFLWVEQSRTILSGHPCIWPGIFVTLGKIDHLAWSPPKKKRFAPTDLQ